MTAERLEDFIVRLERVAGAFEALEPPGRSGIDLKAMNMARKISSMIRRIEEMSRISLCLASRCEGKGDMKVCRSPQGRLQVLLAPNEVSIVRRTDIKILVHYEGREWSSSFMADANGLREKFGVHGGGVRLCLARGASQTCIEVVPDSSLIRDNYSDIRVFAGKIEPVMSRVLEGIRYLARITSPSCLRTQH